MSHTNSLLYPEAIAQLPDEDSWFARWDENIGHPASYLAIDLVTSGLDPATDVIIEAGLCVVRDGKVERRHSTVLDWTQDGAIDPTWLRRQLEETASKVARKGVVYPLNFEALRREGWSARQALASFARHIAGSQRRGEYLVAHNGFSFDVPFLVAQAQRWAGINLVIDPGHVIDTAIMEKASQLNEFPALDEPLGSFWRRVWHIPARGIRWTLHEHCLVKYGLTGLYEERKDRAGHADQEAYAAHLLLEEYRRLAC